MNTAVLPNGISYNIPMADMTFFKELATRMKWEIADKQDSSKTLWVENIGGKKSRKITNAKSLDLEQAMALMDTMMVHGGSSVPADEDCNGALAHTKYDV